MPLYRKKPVVIEARQFVTDNDTDELCMNALVGWIVNNGGTASHNGTDITIATLEGDHRATCGDYIIKGVKGEFYPCKPDIFEATYEAVE
ncbi:MULTISPECIES: hypothetical protein [unclassified Desulfovibrio]|uniref:hypothetical protein n=1 Tax=unclassified Desulfovibrio TaxID=2593640 RepID=UPI002FD954B2